MVTKGNIPWNKGMKGKYHLWDKREHPNKGKVSYFKGHKHSEETKKKISENHSNQNWLGKKHKEDTKKKISLSQIGKKNNLWNGGKMKVNGYIKIYVPNHPKKVQGHVLEHRLVIEKHLGRYLTKEEVVHHINEVRDDNRIENLLLFKTKGEHKKFHLKQTRERLIFLNKENINLKKRVDILEKKASKERVFKKSGGCKT